MPVRAAIKTPTITLLLDAAQAIILERGIGALTLDKVAAKAKVSKGGLLHHFPSKDALLGAIVGRVVDEWRADVRAAIAAEAPGRLRVPRAMLRGCISKPEEWTDTLRNASICVVAAMSEHPRHVEPSREVYAELEATMKADKTPEGLAQLVLCAMDGLWMSFVFGTRAFSRQRLDALAACLGEVVAAHDRAGPTGMQGRVGGGGHAGKRVAKGAMESAGANERARGAAPGVVRRGVRGRVRVGR